MRCLVVYESIFGNTRQVAHAVAAGLRTAATVDVAEVSDAPTDLRHVDLLVVGGPIHAWSLSRPTTRRDARRQAEAHGVAPASPGDGLREWLARITVPPAAAATFDTASPVPRPLPQGSAAAPAARRLAALETPLVAPPEHFRVCGTEGPLLAGEAERATAWAAALLAAPVPEPPPPAPSDTLRFRGAILATATFTALSALGGAAEMLYWPHGSPYLPAELLQYTPFPTFVVPGLILGGAVGGTSALAAVAALRRARYALDATILAGGTLFGFIAAEMAQFRETHWLHALYGGLGLLLLGLGLANRWWTRPRYRWVVGVTLAEAAGFAVPLTAGALAVAAGLGELATAAVVCAAGLGEGLALGVGQGWAMPFPVHRGRFAVATALGAGAAWVIGLTAGALQSPAAFALAGVGCIGARAGAQWLELRRYGLRAGRWLGWTALAWALGLPFTFLPGLLVDASTPMASIVVLWACGGLLMAHVVALVSWNAVQRPAAAG
ncbi:MAG: flavodoxin domain-containing protein [Myxococcota bacterium]